MMSITIYSPFTIVAVPFPFTDKPRVKKRPALVISQIEHQKQTHHVTLAMITTAKKSSWPSDYLLKDLEEAGLSVPPIIRQKIFTVDLRLVIKSVGKLSAGDKSEFLKGLHKHLSI